MKLYPMKYQSLLGFYWLSTQTLWLWEDQVIYSPLSVCLLFISIDELMNDTNKNIAFKYVKAVKGLGETNYPRVLNYHFVVMFVDNNPLCCS